MKELKKSFEIFLVMLISLILASLVLSENFFMEWPLVTILVCLGIGVVDYLFRLVPNRKKEIKEHDSHESESLPRSTSDYWRSVLIELLKYLAIVVGMVTVFSLLKGVNLAARAPIIHMLILIALCVIYSLVKAMPYECSRNE